MRGPWAAALPVAAALALWAPATSAENLTSQGGFLFDVDDRRGTLINGTSDAWDSCYALEVNGTPYQSGDGARRSGRTVLLPPVDVGTLRVTRTVHVPDEAGRDYARYYDAIENRGESDAQVTVRYSGNLGSDTRTTVFRSSSGDRSVGPSDVWFGTDDRDGSGDPSLIHVFFGDGARVRPLSQSLSGDNIDVQFRVALAPGEVAAFLVFAFQAPNQGEARRQVSSLLGDLNRAVRDLAPMDTDHLANFRAFGSGFRSILDAPLPDLDDEAAGSGGSEAVAVDFGAAPAPAARRSGGGGAPAEAEVAPEREPIASGRPRDLVYRGQLRIASRDVPERIRQAVDIADELGGNLVSHDDRNVVIRVPAGRFREALERVEALGDVLRRRISVRQVTERVRDLRIRLRTATEMRDRLSSLLDDTDSVEEALTVRRELERLNREIELLTAELAALEEEVRFATIAIYFQPIGVRREVPRERFALPFEWLDRLGLDRLLNVR